MHRVYFIHFCLILYVYKTAYLDFFVVNKNYANTDSDFCQVADIHINLDYLITSYT